MSRVQLTKTEAIEKIDEILDREFKYFIGLVYDEIVSVINENARVGKKKVKGRLEVGYNPFNEETEHIRFDLDKKEIHDIWKSTLGGKAKNLNDLKKFTKKYDLFCWDYDKYYTFAFKFQDDGIFGSKLTKTGNEFVLKLNSMLGRFGARVKYKRTFMVSRMIIEYVCDIPNGYQPKEKLGETTKVGVADVRETIGNFLDEMDWGDTYSEIGGGAMFNVYVESKELNRSVGVGAMAKAKESMLMIQITLGNVSREDLAEVENLVAKYNETKTEDDFQANIDADGNDYDPILSIIKFVDFENCEELYEKLADGLKKASQLLRSKELLPLAELTSEEE